MPASFICASRTIISLRAMSKSSKDGSANPRSRRRYLLAVLANDVTVLFTSLYQSRFWRPLVGSSHSIPAHSPVGNSLRTCQNCLGTKTTWSTVKSGYIFSNAERSQYVFPIPSDWPVAANNRFLFFSCRRFHESKNQE